MKHPKISVIIPTWNREKTIKRSVASALGQTFEVFEILVCDDGSTDETEEIIEAMTDPRIIWVPGNRGGCPAIPRNRGLKRIKGDWVAFLDSDDEWLPRKIEKQFQLISETKNKVCATNAQRSVPGKGIVGNYFSFEKNEITFEDLLGGNEIICSSLLAHASLFGATGSFPEDQSLKTLEDYALWLRLATQTNVSYIKEPLVVYNDDAKNTHRGKDNLSNLEQKKLVIEDFTKWTKEKNISKGFEALIKAKNKLEKSNIELEKNRKKVDTLKHELESARNQIKAYKESLSYRLGYFLLHPWKFFQKR